jgi:hypothetical protein
MSVVRNASGRLDLFLDGLGRRVREVWVKWAQSQPSPKPTWLVPYDDLSEPDKEVDRRIGAAVWGDCVAQYSERMASNHLLLMACEAFLARYDNDLVRAELLFSDVAELARRAVQQARGHE